MLDRIDGQTHQIGILELREPIKCATVFDGLLDKNIDVNDLTDMFGKVVALD